MFCDKCGSKLPDDAKFCDNCGKAVILTLNQADDDRTVGFADAFPNMAVPKTETIAPKTEPEAKVQAKTEKTEPLNLNDEAAVRRFILEKVPKSSNDAKIALDVEKAMVRLMPSYNKDGDLSSLILASNPVRLAEILFSFDSGTLLCVLSAIDKHLAKNEDGVPLNACRNGVLNILSARVKRGELYA